MKRMWEILVPTIMNDGKPIRTRYHKVWDAKVREITGGLTVMSPNIKGEWTSPSGEIFAERMIPVRIYCSLDEIKKIAKFSIEYYRQEAIMFYCIAEKVWVLEK